MKITSALELVGSIPETIVDPRFMKKLATRMSLARKLAIKETQVRPSPTSPLYSLFVRSAHAFHLDTSV